MGQDIWALVYAAAIGFACAGILASLYQLVSSRPARFMVSVESWFTVLVSVVICTFAGPFILMRNALRGRKIEHRPIGWLFGSSAIASIWSTCSGIVVLNVILSASSVLS